MQNYPENNENIYEERKPAALSLSRLMTLLILLTLLFALLLTTVTCGRIIRREERISILPNEDQDTKQEDTSDRPSNPIFAGGSYAAYPTRAGSYAELGTSVSCGYAALLNASTGEILAGKNADTKFEPASMTKVMTLLVICEHLSEADLDKRVALTQEIYDTVHPTSHNDGYYGADSYFSDKYIGSEIALRTALYGIGVESKADCTLMAVLAVSESEEAFVEMMNAEASAMGLSNTHFDNIIGYESEKNYTTATEMAAILARALRCDLIREILSAPSYQQFEIYDGEDLYHGNIYSTLFNANGQKASRFKDAGIGVGGKLDLQKATFGGGKTGSLKPNGTWEYSLVSFAVAKDGTIYVAVTGETTTKGGVITDSKTIYNKYIP